MTLLQQHALSMRVEKAHPRLTQPPVRASIQTLRIVVIDHNADDREVIRRHLLHDERQRHLLREADTGTKGIALCAINDEQPDCVLLNFHLPDTNALEVITALKFGGDQLPFPIIALTRSIEDADDGQAALALGAQDYLGKSSITSESLSRAVANAVERFHLVRKVRENERDACAAREELAALMETMPAAVLITRDPACREMTANRAAREWLRLSDAHNASQSAAEHKRAQFEVWAGARRLSAEELPMQRAAATGEASEESVCEIIFPDGAKLDLLGHVRPLFTPQGQTRGSIGVFMDITARRRRERNLDFLMNLQKEISQLVSSTEVMRLASEQITQHLSLARCVLADVDESADLCTVVHDHHAGNAPSLVGVHRLSDFHTEDERRWLAAGEVVVISDVRADQRSNERVTQFGSLKIGSLVCASSLAAGGWKFVLSAQYGEPHVWPREDVELLSEVAARLYQRLERVRAEEALRVSEEFSRTVVESSPDCVKVLDAAGSILMMNGTGRCLLEIEDVKPLLGQPWWTLWPEVSRARVRSAVALTKNGELAHFEDFCPTAKGTPKWWDVLVAPVRDLTGAVVRMVVVSRDITKRMQAEQTLRDADRRKDEFLATLAHELRNPLAPIRNAVQILGMPGAPASRLTWARNVIDRQSRQMTRLVDDLLDLSRISRGTIELKRERVELAQAVQQAVETSRPLIESQAHTLTVTLPPERITLDGDLTRLSQVFMNLLNNAAKYTERGGRIALRAQREGDEVVVSVTDSGIGLPADKLTSIFEMFSQVEDALSRSQGGLGIGLSLVKRLVEMHGGVVEARSAGANQGSEFIVRLPLPADPQRVVRTEDDALRTSELRVLVVDDNEDSAVSLAMLLEMTGNTVRTAHDGEQAVKVADELKPHVVLLDLGLPKMSGYEVARTLRAKPWGRTMTLIAVTGWGEDGDKRRTSEAGFDQHMVKPVDAQALMSVLATLQGTR